MSKIEEHYKKIEAKIMEYREKKTANLLLPSLSLQIAEGSVFIPELEAVFISTDAEDKEFYKGSDAEHFRLHSKALYKIAQAGNVEWDSLNSCVINMPGNVVAYRAIGGIRKASGELQQHAGYKDMDLDIALDDIKDQYAKKRIKFDNENKTWWRNMSTEEAKNNYIEACIDRDFRAQRKFAVVKCETGAKCRVIRSLFTMNNEYTKTQLAKPFVVLRYRPNLNHEDPEIKKALLMSSLQAANAIFGPSKEFMQPQIAAPINAQDDPNIDFNDEPQNQTDFVDPPQEQIEVPIPETTALFDALDFGQKIMVIKSLIKSTNYDGPADPDDPMWESHQGDLSKFFDKLHPAADETDEIPY